ncbi:MAG: hypothetical protein U1E27_08910, partial [Kiritimatiellia bacterium]|nr:hypothetical protein [Kiritimatiellia bacterium]
GGVVLRGRPASQDELRTEKAEPVRILRVDEEVLGRNGRHLISRRGAQNLWTLTAAGEQWLQILLFPHAPHSKTTLSTDEDP